MEGFSSEVADAAENTHHYAGQLLAGYYLWEWVADWGTHLREWRQGQIAGTGTDQLDVNMGKIATDHGRDLSWGRIEPEELSDYILEHLAPSDS